MAPLSSNFVGPTNSRTISFNRLHGIPATEHSFKSFCSEVLEALMNASATSLFSLMMVMQLLAAFPKMLKQHSMISTIS